MDHGTNERQVEEPLVLEVRGRKTVVDADVIAPLFWGVEQHQLAQLAAIYEAGL